MLIANFDYKAIYIGSKNFGRDKNFMLEVKATRKLQSHLQLWADSANP